MVGYFKERNSFQVPALLLVAVALKLNFLFAPQINAQPSVGGLLPQWLANVVFPNINHELLATLSILLLTFSALYANYLVNTTRMLNRNNMLVALSVLLFTSLFPASNQLSATTILLPFIILLFQQITKLYNTQKVRSVLINIGLIAGVGYLLYHPFIWLLPCCFVSLAGMRPFKLTEWLLLLLGMLTPFYFILSYEFISNSWQPHPHLLNWHLPKQLPHPTTIWWIGFGITAVWLIAGFVGWQQQTRRMLIQSRQNWYQLLFMGLFIIPMGILPLGNLSETITLLAFPAGSLSANAFIKEQKGKAPVLLFWLIVICIAFIGWMN